GKTVTEVMPQEAAKIFMNAISEAREKGTHRGAVYSLDMAEGKQWYELSIATRECNGGEYERLIVVARNITDRKQAEDALLDSEEKFRVLYNSSQDMYVSVSPDDASIMLCNETFVKKTGYSMEEAIGSSIFDVYHDDCMEEAKKTFQQFVEAGVVKDKELILKRKDGSKIDVSLNVDAVKDDTGKILYSMSSWRDITERKLAEEALRRAKDFSENLIETADAIIVTLDRDAKITTFNCYAEELTGHTKNEVLGKNWFDLFIPKHDKEMIPKVFAAALAQMPEVSNYENPILTKSGSQRLIGWRNSVLKEIGGEIIGVLSIGVDITERKQAEEERIKLSTAVEQTEEMMVITNPAGIIEFVNPAFVQTTGFSADEVIGKSIHDISYQSDNISGYQKMWNAMLSGQVWKGRLTNKRKDNKVYWEDITLSPIRSNSGEIINFVCLKRDITDQLRLEAQLRQAQKLESIGQLAAGIAHELNTPTQYISDNIRFLSDVFEKLNNCNIRQAEMLTDAREVEGAREAVDEVLNYMGQQNLVQWLSETPSALQQAQEGVDRIANIVAAMKIFTYGGKEDKTHTDLNLAIESTIQVSKNEWKYVAEMETDLDPQLPQVLCHPAEISGVILNLIVNAAHAIADIVSDGSHTKGKIQIRTYTDHNYAVIEISDTGTGIPDEIHDRIFDPFFTTKEVGKGTGQGLSIAYSDVVEKHQGSISFETEMGQGTKFIIHLPLDRGANGEGD
ncbi:PAS domain S-box protein, partial [bacterium]|nr:PAS domain S-box protein [bacterium]